ncbi:MAG: tetratricopeptide repeat protein [Pyrinomonadaceae bacterium]
MRRKFVYLILVVCSMFLSGVIPIFAQTNQVDKKIITDFEKSIEQGKIEEIERPLLDFAVANPNDSQVLSLLAKVRFLQNRLPEAAALYKRILSLDANSASAKINLARIAYLSGNFDEAMQMLGGVDENSISDANLRLNLAATFLLFGEPEKGLAATEKLPPKIKNSDALPIIAASYAALKNEKKLRELLPLVKRAAATNPALAAQLAEILDSAGMNQEAVNLLRSTLPAAPNNSDVLLTLAKLEIGAKDFASAKTHLDQAAKLQPRTAKFFFAQAQLAEAQGNSKDALELLKQARTLAPASPEILSQIVISAIRANQARAAVDAAQILANSKPDEPEYLYLLGAASLQNGNINAAQQNLQRLMELRPNDSRGCLALGLTLAAQSDKIEAARKQLLHCIEIDGNNVEAKHQLGLSYKAQGENAKAISYLEETVKAAPNYAAALRDLGAVYLQTGAETKARIALEKAVALAPDDADAHFQLSRLYNLIGETELAKKQLEMFQKLKNSGGK